MADTNWTTILTSIGSTLVSLTAIILNNKSTRASIKANRENILQTLSKTRESKIIEERRQEIYKTLNELYGPLYQLRLKSKRIHEKFNDGKPDNTGRGFSALLYLLKSEPDDSVTESDKILLGELISMGEQCEKIIQEKAGLIDDDELRIKFFPDLSSHFRIIRLAQTGKLKGKVELYQDSIFPQGIDERIAKRIFELQAELKTYNGIDTPLVELKKAHENWFFKKYLKLLRKQNK